MVKAVQTGDQDGVKHLVFAGADLDWHDEKGKDVYTYMYMHICLCMYTCNMQIRDEESVTYLVFAGTELVWHDDPGNIHVLGGFG